MWSVSRGFRALALLALLAGCTNQVTSVESESARSETEEVQAAVTAAAIPAEATRLANGIAIQNDVLDRIFTLDHFVPVGPGRKIHLRETFSVRSLLRWPHRAMVMIPGLPVDGEFYNIPVAGYNGREIMARDGYFAFTSDQEGSGLSTFPEDGFSVTYDLQTESYRKVIEYVRLIRLAPRVDVLGESTGGGVAAQVCANRNIVRKCILGSMIYRTGTDFFNAVFLSPEFQAFIRSQPNGYLQTTPELYFNILSSALPEVADWVRANQPGRYALATLVEDFNLPSYDPSQCGRSRAHHPRGSRPELSSLGHAGAGQRVRLGIAARGTGHHCHHRGRLQRCSHRHSASRTVVLGNRQELRQSVS